MIYWMNRMKTLKKMMLIYIVGGLIPLLIVSTIIVLNTRQALLEQATFDAETTNERIKQEIADIVDTAKDISDGLYLDKELKRMIAVQYTNTMAVIDTMNNYSRIDEYLQLYDEISSVRIYVTNTSMLDNSQIVRITPSIAEEEWYKQAIEADGKTTLAYRYDDLQRENVLSMMRLMRNDQSGILAVTVVSFSPIYLERLLQTQENSMAVFYDHQHHVADSHINSDLVIEQMMTMNDEGNVVTETGEFQLIADELVLKDSYKNIQIKTLVSLSTLYRKANSSFALMFTGVLISTIVSILMVYGLSRSFSKRVERFRDDIHNVALGNFEIPEMLSGDDEIAELYRDLNMMVQSIEKLIHENYEVELQRKDLVTKQKDAQFKMLASQINPHFLYNALETIRMKAIIGKDRDIADVVKKLAVIMRRNLSASNEVVTIKDEVELIKHYLDIQRFRFGDKVAYELEVEEGLEGRVILPLLLQPLVENAFVHGLEGKRGQGHIRIHLWTEEDHLKISVRDNGQGMPREVLTGLIEKLNAGVNSIDGSIGLTNVFQRIKLFYGEESEMELDSEPDVGTSVTLTFDLKKGDNHV